MHGGDKPARKIILDLIRHGEPEGGVKYRGSLDEPLSTTGWQQMRATCAKARKAGHCGRAWACQRPARTMASGLTWRRMASRRIQVAKRCSRA